MKYVTWVLLAIASLTGLAAIWTIPINDSFPLSAHIGVTAGVFLCLAIICAIYDANR